MIKRFNFNLSQDQYEKLKNLEGITISEHIRNAINLYILRYSNSTSSRSPSKVIYKQYER